MCVCVCVYIHTHTHTHTHTHIYIYISFALYYNLLFYIELSVGFWIRWILKKENPKMQLFQPLGDLALDNIYIYIYIYIYIHIFRKMLVLRFEQLSSLMLYPFSFPTVIIVKPYKRSANGLFLPKIYFICHIAPSSYFKVHKLPKTNVFQFHL